MVQAQHWKNWPSKVLFDTFFREREWRCSNLEANLEHKCTWNHRAGVSWSAIFAGVTGKLVRECTSPLVVE